LQQENERLVEEIKQIQLELERLRQRELLHTKYREICSSLLFGDFFHTAYSQMEDGICAIKQENERLREAL